MKKRGLLVVISSPSGGGKSTVIKELLKDQTLPFVYSVSTTTREKRDGEIEGKHYQFVSRQLFEKLIARHEFLEFETVHGELYGTPKAPIAEWINQGKIALLDLDVYGALKVKQKFPADALLIFLKPPDLNTLKKRLEKRSTESSKQISRRLERVAEEMAQEPGFDTVVLNRNLDETVSNIKKIITENIPD